MDSIQQFGERILPALGPTFKAYHPLHTANKSAILSIPRETHRYGQHARQVLDVYPPQHEGPDSPVLVFVYGGGFERGDRTMPSPPAGEGGLVYANMGSYFASKGIMTIIPDYRRTPEGAVYPSGAEDLGAVLDWLKSQVNATGKPRSLYIMGHSAGGVHAATFLLAPAFTSALQSLNSGPLTFQGAVLVSTPCHFRDRDPSREQVLRTYYGERIEEDAPIGLVKGAKNDVGLKVLMINGSLDPEDEIRGTVREFVEAWKEKWGGQSEPETMELDGHNHFSIVLGVGTGVDKEEGLGEAVVRWMGGK